MVAASSFSRDCRYGTDTSTEKRTFTLQLQMTGLPRGVHMSDGVQLLFPPVQQASPSPCAAGCSTSLSLNSGVSLRRTSADLILHILLDTEVGSLMLLTYLANGLLHFSQQHVLQVVVHISVGHGHECELGKPRLSLRQQWRFCCGSQGPRRAAFASRHGRLIVGVDCWTG